MVSQIKSRGLPHDDSNKNIAYDEDDIDSHPSYNQVMLDVNRCAGRLEHIRQVYLHRIDEEDSPIDLTEELEKQRDTDAAESTAEISQVLEDDDKHARTERLSEALQNQILLKERLTKLIVKLLLYKPSFHYYQGFHDVCLTYMTLDGETAAFKKLQDLVETHFKIFMQPTMADTQEFLELIPVIIGFHDRDVKQFLDNSDVGTIFALSWVITWFSHVIPYELDVEKIFRFLEQNDPHIVLYLSAAIVISKRKQLLTLEPEMSTVHHFLSQIPRKEKLPISELLEQTLVLYEKYPPDVAKRQLEEDKKKRGRLHDYNLFQSIAGRIIPSGLSNIVQINPKVVIIVVVLASFLAHQIDRWSK